eukprot:NODE_8661_length_1478_cov_10.836417.p1 GENE.NODE_8661_length_1478_cov_10.836417~~NODE_8661_length_1478_cov_10.836417.p1  ORF type:complete len:281 (-),score=84.36 NODE_8661_length_1478_cov_10.836417:459-1301(-)
MGARAAAKTNKMVERLSRKYVGRQFGYSRPFAEAHARIFPEARAARASQGHGPDSAKRRGDVGGGGSGAGGSIPEEEPSLPSPPPPPPPRAPAGTSQPLQRREAAVPLRSDAHLAAAAPEAGAMPATVEEAMDDTLPSRRSGNTMPLEDVWEDVEFGEGPLGLEILWSMPPVVSRVLDGGAAQQRGVLQGHVLVRAGDQSFAATSAPLADGELEALEAVMQQRPLLLRFISRAALLELRAAKADGSAPCKGGGGLGSTVADDRSMPIGGDVPIRNLRSVA